MKSYTKILLHFKNFFTTTNQGFIFLVFFFYFLFSSNHIFFGGIFYDDWSLSVGYVNEGTLKSKLNDFVGRTYLTRPIGGLYLSFLTEIKKIDHIYILINSTLWLISSFFVQYSFSNILSQKSRNIIFLLILFPSFASTIIFSPVTQSLGVLAIFFWSISLYYSSKKNIWATIFYFLLSVLSYEISIVLLFINIFFFIFNENHKKILPTFFKFFSLFFIIVIGIIIFQNLIANYIGHTKTLKYAFWFENQTLYFEKDFLIYIKKYFFKPIELIFLDIPKLFFNSINYLDLSLINSLYIILYLFLLYFSYQNKIKIDIEAKSFLILIFFLILSSIGVFLVYLIVTSVPQINGYYNRGLASLFVCFSIIIALFNEVNFKKKIIETLKNFFVILILLLNFLSFLTQQQNHIKADKERNFIINKFENFFKNKSNESLVFTLIPTFLKNNYNDEFIFSEEVEDLFFAIRYFTNKKVTAKRIYADNKCQNIINIKRGKITGLVPSKNRKILEKQTAIFINDVNEKIDLYLYANSKFIKLSYDNYINNDIINNFLKCQN